MASVAVEFLLNKLGQLATNEATLLFGLDDEIEPVKRKLEWLSSFLVDADQKRRYTNHELVGVWVKQLREVAYDLEDVLDEYFVKIDLQQRGFSGLKASVWFRCLISPYTQLFTRHDLASRIHKTKLTLEEIANNRAMFLDPINLSSALPDSSTYMRITNLRTEVDEDPTGQDANVQHLLPLILDSSFLRVAIVSIFGMGGLGKTTLAKRLYNDKQVASRFDLHAWLTISQSFSVKDLLTRLMIQLRVEGGDISNEDEMKRKIRDHLSNKSFMIVLDDIWEIGSWECLKAIFPKGHNGITVLLTTRNKNVATYVNPDSEPFELQHLEPEQSWQLFCKKAFTNAHCPNEFQQFKEEVIQRCKGLPLSIVVLGGVLRRRNDSNQWRKVLGNISLNSREEHELPERILGLSYDDLPYHLKACFLYVAGYPEDYEIEARTLKWMWIAEGFIQQKQGQTVEDLAEDYLEELVQRSLIKLVKRDGTGQVSVIQVHDLVLVMARNEAREINFLHQNIPQRTAVNARRISLYADEIDINNLFCNPTPKLRSLCLRSSKVFPSVKFDFQSTNFLRVLSFVGIDFPESKCPKVISNMIQLRYLCFSDTYLYELPYNISSLQNLQTLDIGDTEITRLPEKFWEIASLRHVIGTEDSEIIIPSQQVVSKLQTLIGRPNYEWIMKDGLQMLTNIRTLNLSGVSKKRDQNIDLAKVEEKIIDAIEKLNHLTELFLGEELASTRVLTARCKNLQYLELHRGERFGENKRPPVLGQDNRQNILPNLHTLVFRRTKLMSHDIEMIGLLPNLKSLSILWEDELRKLVFKEGYFSSLQLLCLRSCFNLVSWEVNGDWSMSTPLLQILTIDCCPRLKFLPEGLQVKEIQLGRSDITHEVEEWAQQHLNSVLKGLVVEELKTLRRQVTQRYADMLLSSNPRTTDYYSDYRPIYSSFTVHAPPNSP